MVNMKEKIMCFFITLLFLNMVFSPTNFHSEAQFTLTNSNQKNNNNQIHNGNISREKMIEIAL